MASAWKCVSNSALTGGMSCAQALAPILSTESRKVLPMSTRIERGSLFVVVEEEEGVDNTSVSSKIPGLFRLFLLVSGFWMASWHWGHGPSFLRRQRIVGVEELEPLPRTRIRETVRILFSVCLFQFMDLCVLTRTLFL